MRLPASIAFVSLFGWMIAACGGSSSDGGTSGAGGTPVSGDRDKFVAVWAPSTPRTTQVTCAGFNVPATLTQTLEWKLSDSSDLVGGMAGCSLKANIANNVASVLPGQVCALTDPIPLTLTFTSYTFTLGADGTTATDASQGTAKVTYLGQQLDCTYSETGQYSKQAN